MSLNIKEVERQLEKARNLVLDEEVFGSLGVVATQGKSEIRSFDPNNLVRPTEHGKPELEIRLIELGRERGIRFGLMNEQKA